MPPEQKLVLRPPANRRALRNAPEASRGLVVSRRAALGVAAALFSTPAWLAAGAGYALKIEPRLLEVTRTTIALARLPAAFSGLRVVHMSDLHIGPDVKRDHIRSAVEVANALDPDLVVITGDFVYYSLDLVDECAEELAALTPRGGTCAVLGNHDVWTSAARIAYALTGAGIRVLSDDKVALEAGAQRLWLIGIQDRGYSGGYGGSAADFNRQWHSGLMALERIVTESDADEAKLLLVHNPDFCEVLSPGMVDLALCGHTHGGQVRLPLVGSPIIPSNYGQKYACGMVEGPGCPVYVTRGVGVTRPPVRFGCRPEVSLLTLVSA